MEEESLCDERIAAMTKASIMQQIASAYNEKQ